MIHAILCVLLGSGVVEPTSGFGDAVERIGAHGTESYRAMPDPFAGYVRQALPPDDRGKFYITCYVTKDSQAAALLKRDFREHPALRAIGEWGTLQFFDWNRESAAEQARWRSFGVRYTPTIMVYPRPGHPTLPFKFVIASNGYGGDADILARQIYAGVRRLYTLFAPQQCPGPYCPTPQPHSPQPHTPQPNDWPAPEPLPLLPQPAGPEVPLLPVEPPLGPQPGAEMSISITTLVAWAAVIALVVVVFWFRTRLRDIQKQN